MRKNWEDLAIGDSVHDMHNGRPDLNAVLKPQACETTWIQIDGAGGCDFITKLTGRQYTNKMLVVVGSGEMTLTLAYSYDDRYFGICHLSL